jgi:hypothetical protein
LRPEQQRRVASWVFFVIEESRKHGHSPKVQEPLDLW